MRKPTEQAEKLMENFVSFSIKWGTSRGYSTYGYITCSMRLTAWNGVQKKVAYCSGGGYDMKGTVLGKWMQEFFTDDIKKLSSSTGSRDTWKRDNNTFYGVNFYDRKRRKFRKNYKQGYEYWLDGGCGFSCMETILKQFGIALRYQRINANEDLYIFEYAKQEKRHYTRKAVNVDKLERDTQNELSAALGAGQQADTITA